MVGEGYQMMGTTYYLKEAPSVLVDFARHIAHRENIVLPEPLETEFIGQVCLAALSYLDVWDPRFPFHYTDVAETDDWMHYTYKLNEPGAQDSADAMLIGKEELPKLETFRRVPQQDESFFNEFYNCPNFRYSMFYIQSEIVADYFRDYVNDGEFDYALGNLSDPAEQQAENFFYENKRRRPYLNPDGQEEHREPYYTGSREDTVDLLEHVTEVIASAALVWFCSPMARKFRCDNHEIFYLLDQYEEIIIYDYCIYTPRDYEKVAMPPTCCSLCGLDAYCVDLVHGIEGETLQVCNGCLSKGRPTMPNATCGTTFCKHIECIYNKYNGMGERGRYAMDRANPYSYVSYKQRQAPKKEQDLIATAFDKVTELLG